MQNQINSTTRLNIAHAQSVITNGPIQAGQVWQNGGEIPDDRIERSLMFW